MSRPGPRWLADLQSRFGAVIRAPLDRASGTLTAVPADYDPRLSGEVLDGPQWGAVERLAVYNRQYWFRLFGVLQAGFPLTARLMGYWSFNGLAANYLTAHPPSGWDIEQVADGFREFVEQSMAHAAAEWNDSVRLALIESVRIDAAYRDVFRAPSRPRLRPSVGDTADLLTGQLVVHPALRVVEEHRPLMALRATLLASSKRGTVDLPPLLIRPQTWVVVRVAERTARVPIEDREAELLRLLERHSVADALARLEGACPVEERAGLPERVRAWLARGIDLGYWSSIQRRS